MKSNIKSIIDKNKIDYVIYMNNCTSLWESDKAKEVLENFPTAKTLEVHSNKNLQDRLGTVTSISPYIDNKDVVLINVHTRINESDLNTTNESIYLREAIDPMLPMFINSSILLIKGDNSSISGIINVGNVMFCNSAWFIY